MANTEGDLLAAVSRDLEELGTYNLLEERDPTLSQLKSMRDAIDAADPASPVVEWLLREHQVGAVVFAAIGLNRTEPRLQRAWDRWREVTRDRVVALQTSSADRLELAGWGEEALGYTKDPLSILREG